MIKGSVESIMTDKVVKIKDNATIKQVAHILLRFRINGLLVISSKTNEIIGVITTTDLLRLLDKALSRSKNRLERLKEVGNIPVMSVANRSIVGVQKHDKIKKAVVIMHKKSVHTLPVYDGDRLVGVIGRHDVLNLAFAE